MSQTPNPTGATLARGQPMPLRTKTRPYWTCRRCGFRNLRAHVKCRGESCDARRPKKPVRAHARVIQGDTYPLFVQAARDIHGVMDESCCACGKPRSQERHHDRDHDHLTGKRRGLLCGGNRGCNVLLVPWVTAPVARAIYSAKRGEGAPDASRWGMLARYLTRVEAYYSERPV